MKWIPEEIMEMDEFLLHEELKPLRDYVKKRRGEDISEYLYAYGERIYMDYNLKALAPELDDIFTDFELTEQSLENMKGQAVPKEILVELEKLKNKKNKKEDIFLNDLEKAIGKEQTVRHKSTILNYTKKYNEYQL